MKLERHHYAAIISGLILSITVLIAFNIHLGSLGEEEEYFYEVMVEETTPEEKEQERLEEIAQLNQPKTHTAFNEAGKFQNNTDDFKTLEELMESRQNDATLTQEENTDGEGDDEFMSSMSTIAAKRAEKRKTTASNGANISEILAQNSGVNKNSSISYSLVDRYLPNNSPNPIYTCAESGKVVVNIVVNAQGTVIEATINRSSNNLNGCLTDNAIAYALQSRFNQNSAKSTQIGTITYLFQPK